MPASFVDEGLVLRRRAFNDADRILVVFTRDHGKLSVLARGARRAKSRAAAGLDLLTRTELQLTPGRGLGHLGQARPLGPPWPVDDALRTACGAVLAELVDATLEEFHPDPELYFLVAEARDRMAVAGSDCRAELCLAAFRLAAVGGYRPEVNHCAGCGGGLRDRDSWFDTALGGVVQGEACRPPNGLPCSAAALRVLRRMDVGDEGTLRRLRWTATLRDELESILLAHLEHHLDRRLRAARILHQLHSPA